MQGNSHNSSEAEKVNSAEIVENKEHKLQEEDRRDNRNSKLADDKDYVNAIRLASATYVLDFVLYDMKGRYNQRAKMLINNAIKHTNKLVDLIERNFDEQAEDGTAEIAENYLALLDEFLVCKNQTELFSLIKAYNNGEVEVYAEGDS